MGTRSALIGRERERARLEAGLERAERGAGGLILLSGEAGVGKTRLAEELAGSASGIVLRGAATADGTAPHGPIVAALRSRLRAQPGALDSCGPLRSHLALLLPELGDAAAGGDRETLFEAIRCALATIAAEQPTLVVLDDLQWSDHATLEALASLAASLPDLPVLVLAAYRSDEVTRDHPMRRLRGDLRRAGILDELELASFELEQTEELAERALGGPASASLARAIQDRTQGIPFFVEELASALVAAGAVRPGRRGLELTDEGEVPVPSTVRDAVMLRLAGTSTDGLAAAETASVAGERFDLAVIGELASPDGLTELVERGLLVEGEPGRARFRHALTREAIYAGIPWLRRQELHRRLAEHLESTGGARIEIAAHWRGAHDDARARESLLVAMEEFTAVLAYRDAANAGREVLELWSESGDGDREAALVRYAHCSELAGELAEAARAWREVAVVRRAEGEARGLAEAERRLAGVYGLQGDRKRALASRRAAAEAFASLEMPAEAATDRLVAANYLQSSGEHSDAVAMARAAAEEARAAGRHDLRARALGVEGAALAKRGELEEGLATVRTGLSLALEHDLTADAADLYQRLGTAFETAGDYGGASDALDSALGLCETTGEPGPKRGCVACMAYVLRELGEWNRSAELCRELIEDESTPASVRVVSDGILGSIRGFRGELAPARQLLNSCLEIGRRLDVVSMTLDSAAALAWIERAEGDLEAAGEHCEFLLERWRRSEDRHYGVWGLRWAASHFGRAGDAERLGACTEALGRIATETGHADAMAALAQALGETALLEGDAELAAEQLGRALELHAGLEMPFERAQIQARAGVALAAAGERDLALERFGNAYRTARKLGARPLAVEAAGEVAALGESVEERLGRRAAADHEGGGLSRRELEVLRLAAVGRTNREIGGELYLSPRTVDMHVRNTLAKLGCRSRVEAATRARELGIIE